MADPTTPVALPTISPADLRVDARGRVVIADAALAERIKAVAALPTDPLDEVAGNGICCGNTGCLSEQLVGLFESLVARTRPR